MDAVYQFKGISSRAFSPVNDGTIARYLQVSEAAREGGFGYFLHQGLGLMNYTNQGQPLSYTVTPTAQGYALWVHWSATSVKAKALLEFLAQLRQGQQPDPGTTSWRQRLVYHLTSLLAADEHFVLTHEPGPARAVIMTLSAEVKTAALEAAAADRDIELAAAPPALLPPPRMVPYELVAGVIGENLAAARALYGKDHAALLAVALPLTGFEVMADVLVGFTYYLYLNQPQRAYPFLRRVADQAASLDRWLARYVLDFVGNIEFGHLRWPGQAEYSLVRSLALGNDYALLKLAYLYLQQASMAHREQAGLLARHGELLLSVAPEAYDEADPNADDGPAPHDPDQRRAGYHIIASVYLWNRDVLGAARAHAHFMNELDWCQKHRKLVEGYLLLAFALNDVSFLTDLITDYPILREEFGLLLGAWHYSVVEPEAEGFTMRMVPIVNQIEGARRRYFG